MKFRDSIIGHEVCVENLFLKTFTRNYLLIKNRFYAIYLHFYAGVYLFICKVPSKCFFPSPDFVFEKWDMHIVLDVDLCYFTFSSFMPYSDLFFFLVRRGKVQEFLNLLPIAYTSISTQSNLSKQTYSSSSLLFFLIKF